MLDQIRLAGLVNCLYATVLDQIWLKYTTRPDVVDYVYRLLRLHVLDQFWWTMSILCY